MYDSWYFLMAEGYIEYISGDNNNVLIANTPKHVAMEKKNLEQHHQKRIYSL